MLILNKLQKKFKPIDFNKIKNLWNITIKHTKKWILFNRLNPEDKKDFFDTEISKYVIKYKDGKPYLHFEVRSPKRRYRMSLIF